MTHGVLLKAGFHRPSCTPHPHAKRLRPARTQKLHEELSALTRSSCSLRYWHMLLAALVSSRVLHLVLGPHFLWDVDKPTPIERRVTDMLRGHEEAVRRAGEGGAIASLFAATERVSSLSACVCKAILRQGDAPRGRKNRTQKEKTSSGDSPQPGCP